MAPHVFRLAAGDVVEGGGKRQAVDTRPRPELQHVPAQLDYPQLVAHVLDRAALRRELDAQPCALIHRPLAELHAGALHLGAELLRGVARRREVDAAATELVVPRHGGASLSGHGQPGGLVDVAPEVALDTRPERRLSVATLRVLDLVTPLGDRLAPTHRRHRRFHTGSRFRAPRWSLQHGDPARPQMLGFGWWRTRGLQNSASGESWIEGQPQRPPIHRSLVAVDLLWRRHAEREARRRQGAPGCAGRVRRGAHGQQRLEVGCRLLDRQHLPRSPPLAASAARSSARAGELPHPLRPLASQPDVVADGVRRGGEQHRADSAHGREGRRAAGATLRQTERPTQSLERAPLSREARHVRRSALEQRGRARLARARCHGLDQLRREALPGVRPRGRKGDDLGREVTAADRGDGRALAKQAGRSDAGACAHVRERHLDVPRRHVRSPRVAVKHAAWRGPEVEHRPERLAGGASGRVGSLAARAEAGRAIQQVKRALADAHVDVCDGRNDDVVGTELGLARGL